MAIIIYAQAFSLLRRGAWDIDAILEAARDDDDLLALTSPGRRGLRGHDCSLPQMPRVYLSFAERLHFIDWLNALRQASRRPRRNMACCCRFEARRIYYCLISPLTA